MRCSTYTSAANAFVGLSWPSSVMSEASHILPWLGLSSLTKLDLEHHRLGSADEDLSLACRGTCSLRLKYSLNLVARW